MDIKYSMLDDVEKLPQLGELYREWTGKGYNPKFMLCNCHFIVACDGDVNHPVGALQLITVDDPFFQRIWGLVENVFVKSEYRRYGVASGMMKKAEQIATVLGCEFVKLTSRKEEGKALYRDLEYEEGSCFRKELYQNKSIGY